jgi:hypothetical protein
MTRRELLLRSIISIGAFWLAACGRDLNTAQGVAEEFLDQYYVNIDLQKAKQHTVSVASAKIEEQLKLTTGQKIDASTQRPRVNYSLLEKEEGEQRSTYLYEGNIQSNDGTSFTRKWRIAARKEKMGWRISNFSESE